MIGRMPDPPELPRFVGWPIFPFEGDLRVKPIEPLRDADFPRSGEPGGAPCRSCASADDAYVWVDERWRIRATEQPTGVPVQLFVETREHLDLDDLDAQHAAELGQLLVRVDRAVLSLETVGRTHIARWGDGGSHFHIWAYGRPRGTIQMLGFGLPMWAQIHPPTPQVEWDANLRHVAAQLAGGGGRAMLG